MSLASIVKSLGSEELRLNELGKIKIGGLGKEKKAASGRMYRTPEKHDHFTVTTLYRRNGKPDGDLMPDAPLMEQLTAEYGDDDGKLRQIPIRLLSDDIDDVLQTAWVWYGKKSVGARSDGEKLTWFYDPRNMRAYEPPLEEPWTDAHADMVYPGDERKDRDKQRRVFKLHSVLNCVIAAKESRFGGVYKFRTTSMVSFKQLYASLVHISSITGGILRGMPIFLCVRPIQVSPNGQTTTVYIVHAELRGAEIMDIQRMAMAQAQWAIENKTRMKELTTQYRALLAAPGTEHNEAAGDIAAEFQPEAQTIESAPADFDIIDGDTVAGGELDAAPTDALKDAESATTETPETLDVSTWATFGESIVALAVRDGVTEPTAEGALEVLRRTNCGSPLPLLGPPARQKVIDAINHGAFDWVNGQVAV